MQQVLAQQPALYREHFDARRKERRAEPVWMIERRLAAMDAFEAQGLPTRRLEAWRNINLSALAEAEFPVVHIPGEADEQVEALSGLLPEAWRLVFIDGHFNDRLSMLPEQDQITVKPLSECWDEEDGALAEHLGRYAPEHPFGFLNTAFFEDGSLVRLGRGAHLTQPLLIIHVASEEASGRAIHPRTLILAEEGAEASVVEFYQGPDQRSLRCPVTEIVVGANARVSHYKVQEEGESAFHFGIVAARLARDANLVLYSFSDGGRQARTDIQVELAEPGGEVWIDGLYLTREGQYNDHHTVVRHQAEHCNSHQRFKGVLSGRSEAVYDGLVQVAKGAQKTDARQDNRNLLLSKWALAHSNPRLEIYADDVKCSHGSTTGELDEDAVFYLRSRGIGAEDAQGLLTYAFIGEVLEPVAIPELKSYLSRAALSVLPGEQMLEELP